MEFRELVYYTDNQKGSNSFFSTETSRENENTRAVQEKTNSSFGARYLPS